MLTLIIFFLILVVVALVAYHEGYYNAIKDTKEEFPDYEEYGQ